MSPQLEPFNRFLAWLDPEPQAAGKKYLLLYRRLQLFFHGRGCGVDADALADMTVDRAARRYAAGDVLSSDPLPYCLAVARYIFLEHSKKPKAAELAFEPAAPPQPDDTYEGMSPCLNRCLRSLPPDDEALVRQYYEGEKQERIRGRGETADRVGLSKGGLRVEVYRIRKKLKTCVTDCLQRRSRTVTFPEKGPHHGRHD